MLFNKKKMMYLTVVLAVALTMLQSATAQAQNAASPRVSVKVAVVYKDLNEASAKVWPRRAEDRRERTA